MKRVACMFCAAALCLMLLTACTPSAVVSKPGVLLDYSDLQAAAEQARSELSGQPLLTGQRYDVLYKDVALAYYEFEPFDTLAAAQKLLPALRLPQSIDGCELARIKLYTADYNDAEVYQLESSTNVGKVYDAGALAGELELLLLTYRGEKGDIVVNISPKKAAANAKELFTAGAITCLQTETDTQAENGWYTVSCVQGDWAYQLGRGKLFEYEGIQGTEGIPMDENGFAELLQYLPFEEFVLQ